MIIYTENLTKLYGRKTGCRNVSLSVFEGEIFGFLGPNGAGKSTFTKMLVGLLFPTSGKAKILGAPPGDVRARMKIGFLPENFRYQDWMTGADLLSFHSSLYKMDKKLRTRRINEVLELVKLKDFMNYKIGTYSKGMQQRIGIASALLPDPRLLFLDEPTSALDPIGRKEIRDVMLNLKKTGTTIFLNSHMLSEVEMLCDSLAFINRGSIIKQGKMADILDKNVSLAISAEGVNELIRAKIRKLDRHAVFKENSMELNIKNKEDAADIAQIIYENGGRIYEMTPRRQSLEDLFISLIEGGNT